LKSSHSEPQDIIDENIENTLLTEVNTVSNSEADTDKTGAPREEHIKRRWILALKRPTRGQALTALAFCAIIVLGACLRFWDLGDKPLHHDESLHAFFSLQLMHDMESWFACFAGNRLCYHYDPLTHGPFQFHGIALIYKLSQWLGAPENGVSTTTTRILAATLGTAMIGLPYFLRNRLGILGAWIASLLLAVSPGMVYFSRFAREDIYMAFFTLLLVVCVACYLSVRRRGWLIGAAIAFSLSYATKEATFLTIAIFGSFLGALLAWELGVKWRAFQIPVVRKAAPGTASDPIRLLSLRERLFFHSSAPIALMLYWLTVVPLALLLLTLLKLLAMLILTPGITEQANLVVSWLEALTIVALPVLTVWLGYRVFQRYKSDRREEPTLGRWQRWRAQVNPATQPLLNLLLTTPWTYWLLAFLVGWGLFVWLYSISFTYLAYGVADGIWQGLYYWIQQIAVVRGDQPWYYYLLLIPLYEQVAVVFGIVGLVRCLVRPTRFRLFLVYWFLGNFFIYSWAAEKMPWLMIHMTMPLILLAAIGLEPAAHTLVEAGKQVFFLCQVQLQHLGQSDRKTLVPRPYLAGRTKGWSVLGAGATLMLAGALLVSTLDNMYQVTYLHAADAPHEMMVYVQTTVDINKVIARVDELDQKLYHGNHKLSIGLTDNGAWPAIWYLREYPNICRPFPSACPATAKDVQVIIAGQEEIGDIKDHYASGDSPAFLYHEYIMRSWWSEGYKPPATCVPTTQDQCIGKQTWGGVGPWLWLSYGDNPPTGAQFNIQLAANNLWQWWWQRKPFGSTEGAYSMGLFIRTDLGVAP
jgi:predicted membrane-bound mannosyltransferase